MDCKCVISLGFRCFTEIFLKEMGIRQFSSPLGSLYLANVDDIILLLNNGINYSKLYHTKYDIRFKKLNDKHGNRSIDMRLNKSLHKYNFDIKLQYDLATFAHHDMTLDKNIEHFNRCFNRIIKISKNKIRTLFCLFTFHKYLGYNILLNKDCIKLAKYLHDKFNCYLLIIDFRKYSEKTKYRIIEKNNFYIRIQANSSREEYHYNAEILDDIFYKLFKINKEELLKYDEI